MKYFKWASRAATEGVDEATKGRQCGRQLDPGRSLTLVQEARLQLQILGSNPAQLQLEFALWNCRVMMLAIKKLFGLDMPIRTVGECLRRGASHRNERSNRAQHGSGRGKTRSIQRSLRAPRPRVPGFTGVMNSDTAGRELGPVLFLIVDNLRLHRAIRVRKWVEESAGRSELFYLPPCRIE